MSDDLEARMRKEAKKACPFWDDRPDHWCSVCQNIKIALFSVARENDSEVERLTTELKASDEVLRITQDEFGKHMKELAQARADLSGAEARIKYYENLFGVDSIALQELWAVQGSDTPLRLPSPEKLVAVFEERHKLRADLEWAQGLVSVARCPNCDGSGSYGRDDGYGNEVETQCQWCDEKQALAKRE